MPGSGFVPSGIYGVKLGVMAGLLAQTTAYADFVGEEIAALAASGMYFYGIDRRDLEANEEDFPGCFVIWSFGEDYEKYSTQSGSPEYKFRGSVTLTMEANTPEEFARNTPGAYNWIMNHAQAMVRGMELLFGQATQEIAAHRVTEGPYREAESGVEDYVGLTIEFELRN